MKEILAILEWQAAMGADEALEVKPVVRRKKPVIIEASKPTAAAPSPAPIPVTAPVEAEQEARKLADAASNLDELRAAVAGFKALSICRTATNTVFSDGNPHAPIMFIGEAPGENEDLRGIPFCGDSGQLMDELLKWAGFTREKNIYISNTLFWRPPGNRRPTPEELAVCRPFVEKHIALIMPKFLVLVGGTATLSLLNSNVGITKLRKEKHSYKNRYIDAPIPTAAVFHPSYLLRSPLQKRSFWLDILGIRQELREQGVV